MLLNKEADRTFSHSPLDMLLLYTCRLKPLTVVATLNFS